MFNKILLLISITALFGYTVKKNNAGNFITYEADLKKVTLKLYWKNSQGNLYRNFTSIKADEENKHHQLLFAMNGGMYKTDNSPLGLYIENFKTISVVNKASGGGNFYLKPNGIFYITKENVAAVVSTENFSNSSNIKYATQSGPMLLINGSIHPDFKKGSTRLNIRNGIGILPNGNPIFVMSKTEVSFYDFADYFKSLGCKNALYLDGFVSRTYLPEQHWLQTDGDFGVMIGVTKSKRIQKGI